MKSAVSVSLCLVLGVFLTLSSSSSSSVVMPRRQPPPPLPPRWTAATDPLSSSSSPLFHTHGGRTRPPPPGFSPSPASPAPSSQEVWQQTREAALAKARELSRSMKLAVSSDFERMLLEATWPNDLAVPEASVRRILASVRLFPQVMGGDKDNDPFARCLAKLWAKVSERDYRTKLKAWYILHRLARDADRDLRRQFATALEELAVTPNPRSPALPYFNLAQALDVDAAGESFVGQLGTYGAFVFRRALGNAQETPTESSMRELVEFGLEAVGGVDGDSDEDAVTVSAMRTPLSESVLALIMLDLRDLWEKMDDVGDPGLRRRLQLLFDRTRRSVGVRE